MRQYAPFERPVEAGEAPSSLRATTPPPRAGAGVEPEAEGGRASRPRRTGLEAEQDNPAAALGPRRGLQQALRFAVHMWPMWMAGSHFQEGGRWLREAFDTLLPRLHSRVEALRAMCGGARPPYRSGELSDAGRSGSPSSPGARLTAAAAAPRLDEVGVYEYMGSHYDRAERLYAESRPGGSSSGRSVRPRSCTPCMCSRPLPRRLHPCAGRRCSTALAPVARYAGGRHRGLLPRKMPSVSSWRSRGAGECPAAKISRRQLQFFRRVARGGCRLRSSPRLATARAPRG